MVAAAVIVFLAFSAAAALDDKRSLFSLLGPANPKADASELIAAVATASSDSPHIGGGAVAGGVILRSWSPHSRNGSLAVAAQAPSCVSCASSPPTPPLDLSGMPTNRYLAPQLERGQPPLPADLAAVAARTVFLVFSPPAPRKERVLSTWAAGVPNVVFVGDTTCGSCELQVALPGPDSWEQLPAKNRAVWAPALARFPDAQAFVKVDMDAYIIVENLYEAIALHEARTGRWPDYMGSEYTFALPDGVPLRYCSGGAGYIVSRRAAEALAASTMPLHAYEDVQTGLVLRDASPPFLPTHHHGFVGDELNMALMFWLRGPEWQNHHAETQVPAALISVHGYKNNYALAGLDILTRARLTGSLRSRVGPEPASPNDANGVDLRTAFDICCAPGRR